MKKSNLSLILALVGVFTLRGSCLAQSEPQAQPNTGFRFEVSGAQSKDVELELDSASLSKVESERFSGSATYSWSIESLGYLEASIHQSRITVDFEQASSARLIPDEFNTLGFELSLLRPFSDRWTGFLDLDTSYRNADNSKTESDSLGVIATAIGFYELNPQLRFAIGMEFDSLAVSSNRFFPVIGFDWQPKPQWRIALGFPETGVFYQVGDSLSLGLAFEVLHDAVASTSLSHHAPPY